MRSIEYWNNRYKTGDDSGDGSKNELLIFKTNFINNFIKENNLQSLTDFGHGDLSVANLLLINEYTGIDIFTSTQNIKNLNLVKSRFDTYDGNSTDLVICLDVLYHILEDEQEYLKKSLDKMIEISKKFIIIYSNDSREPNNEYKHHLYNSKWLQYLETKNNLKLIYEQKNYMQGCSAKFFIYEKKI